MIVMVTSLLQDSGYEFLLFSYLFHFNCKFIIQKNITFTCIADGSLLNILEEMDLCSLLGNTLDNAIESALTISKTEKRLINLRISKKNDFILFSLENYTENDLIFNDKFPLTTKKNKNVHGYGLKSIDYIARKYNGSVTINLDDNWFKLKVLFPV